jgi:hypothetical protein
LPAGDPAEAAEAREIARALAEEIGRLPAGYRCAVDLCDIQGMTLAQASRQLECPLATVKSRLARGRLRLRTRLARRGLAPAAAAVALSQEARAAVPAGLVRSTADAARAGSASALSKGVLRMMMWQRLGRIAAGAVLGLGLAAGTLAQQGEPGKGRNRAGDRKPPVVEADRDRAEKDARWSRTLPCGAKVRIIGVRESGQAGPRWWRPDGSPIRSPLCDGPRSTIDPNADERIRTIAFQLEGMPEDSRGTLRVVEAGSNAFERARRDGKDLPGMEIVTAAFPLGKDRCTVLLEVAAGDWATVQQWGKSPGALGSRDGASFVFGEPIATRNGTTLSVTHTIEDRDVRLVALGADGSRHPATVRSGGGAWNFRQIVGEFDLPPDKISGFEVQTRDYQRAEIPGVRLQPADAP